MKHTIWARLLCLLLAGILLAGCSQIGGSSAGAQHSESRRQLERLLDELAEVKRPDSLGSALTIARLTLELINWVRTTDMDAAESAATVADWIEAHPDKKQQLTDSLHAVSDTLTSFLEGTGSLLMETIGLDDLSFLNDALLEILGSILDF